MSDDATGATVDGLVFAQQLDGAGGAREVGWDACRAHAPGSGVLWMHLDRAAAATRRWLEEDSGLDPLSVEALLAEETRPRSLAVGDGLIIILRGVNLNPGAQPEDMVSIRAYVDRDRLITLRHRRLLAAQDLREALAAGRGPEDSAGLLIGLCEQLVARMEPVIEGLEEAIGASEVEVLEGKPAGLRRRLGALRREAIALRRYLAPQRDAIARVATERVAWLDELDRARLREVGDRVTRFVEDLDAARERAAVVQEEVSSRTAEQMNRTMYMLSLVAALFLPLGFLTGLLGINVGGIPGGDDPLGFLAVCGLLAAIVALQVWIFRRFGWF